MDLYIVVNNSESLNNQSEKVSSLQELSACIVDGIDKKNVHVHIICIKTDPQPSHESLLAPKFEVIGHNQQKGDEVRDLFKKIQFTGIIDYKSLADFFASIHPSPNYEVVILTDANVDGYLPVDESMAIPALTRFIVVDDYKKGEVSAKYAVDLEQFAIKCAKEARIFHRYVEKDFAPIYVCDFPSVKACAEKFAKESRTLNNISISISPNCVINAMAIPGIPNITFELYGFEVYKIHAEPENETSANFTLIGFTKSTQMINFESCPIMHAIKPIDEKSSFFNSAKDPKSITAFHLLAESMGTEGQVAVLRHSSGEEAFLKPIRDEITQPWRLVMQFYPSHRLRWTLENKMKTDKKKEPLLIMEKGLSYKVTTTRTYWSSKETVTSEINKIHKHLKRADRIENFYNDLRRMTRFGIATGNEMHGRLIVEALEKKRHTFDPANKPHVDKVILTLKNGGWKALHNHVLK